MACIPSGLLSWSPLLARVMLLGLPLVSGCANPTPAPPFATVPYQQFSRAAVVAITMREWKAWGSQVNDDDHLNWDKPEREEGLWQRVGEYWWIGMPSGSPESRWTGKHDEYGQVFPADEDGKYAWSAAFVSYVMRIAGAGNRFPYSPDHAYYINIARQMAMGTAQGWLVTAERPEAYAPQPGDLVCYGRDQAASLRYDNLPTAEAFPSHCDIVVEAPGHGTISVIGGNVQDTVTLRHVPVTPDGKLAQPNGAVVDPLKPWMVVLRVLSS